MKNGKEGDKKDQQSATGKSKQPSSKSSGKKS